MRLNFQVQATVFSAAGGINKFPANVINRVIVCNRDGCSYVHLENVQKGTFDVDFDLVPQADGVLLRDTLKFHFYTGNSVPIVVAAGGIPMQAVKAVMAHEKVDPFHISCNFSPVVVMVQLVPLGEPAHLSLPAMEPSAVHNTEQFVKVLNAACTNLSKVINLNLTVSPQNGAPMFCNLATCHNMTKEATTHAHYQSDVQPEREDGELFFKSGLTMVALASALHVKSLPVEEALHLSPGSREFTGLVMETCQAYIRSAHIMPYVPDKVLAPGLDAAGGIKHFGSESFKLIFREPFHPSATQSTYLHADDCEGHAAFMLYLFSSFKTLFEEHKDALLHEAFPSHLLRLSATEKQQLWDLAMRIGQCASENKLRCDVILISAGSAALGDGGSQLGGHATCVLVNSHDPDKPYDMLMEGTNSMMWDDDARSVHLTKAGLVPMQVPLNQVANMLTMNIAGLLGPSNEADVRKLIHMNKQMEGKFYKSAFCQNGHLVASKTSEFSKPSFGINMEMISDYDTKVYMPISAQLINQLASNPKASTFMDEHRARRRCEIHPPRTTLTKVQTAIAHWSPLELFKPDPKLLGRQYKVCLTMRSVRDPDERNMVHAMAMVKAAEWNKKFEAVGKLSTYVAFDTVFTKLCMWTDDLPTLQHTLSSLMSAAEHKPQTAQPE